ncbi:MAG TPA: CRISPR-associated endonuclease Cas2 [Candidatus Nanoarchaeia archaeon]|nr:CRISPR-associated endoribonuclease Cas2 [uncultured archaeon]
MKVLVVYDISQDKERGKVAEICLDYGLERIQKSAFLGELSETLRQRLVGELKEKLVGKTFNLQVFELDKNSAKKRLVFEAKKKG